MVDKVFPQSGLPIRKINELLPTIFRTDANEKLFASTLDAFVQPGVLQKTFGFIGKRFGKTYNGQDVYLDDDDTLRSRYQLETAVIIKDQLGNIDKFYDYIDLKNQLKFFGNNEENDSVIFTQEHYSWDPPIDWDKFVNYREYYWEPLGPPAVQIAGQSQAITSRYRVTTGSGSTWIFSPDGLTNNPTLTLYRGQTYYFDIIAPGQQFVIRSRYDTTSLLYDPNSPYGQGQTVIFDDKLWRARKNIPAGDGSTIDEDTEDWEYVENVDINLSVLTYNNGVTNNGISIGVLEFKVPLDAPDNLFYQSFSDPDRLGRFIIADIGSNTKIDVENEILGKAEYVSSNGVAFTNGLVVEFIGQVKPTIYTKGTWLVEGVGSKITLTRFDSLVVPDISKTKPDVLFDAVGFDQDPFDSATNYPDTKDYIVIRRDSRDLNPWSRYNRWFHRSVLEYAYKSRGVDFVSREESRAKRPIIEFKSNLKLYNHGYFAKETVDFIDDFTDDVFSIIEGSEGFFVDGESLFDGARLLVTGDKDTLSNNRIYVVRFINHNGKRQITLQPSADSESNLGECVLIRRGLKNSGLMYHYAEVVDFDNTTFSLSNKSEKWIKSQEKISTNQPVLFDVFDKNGVSLADKEIYPVSNFQGTQIISYKKDNSNKIDPELGFQTSYLNIDNIGDVLFQWDWELQTFSYTIDFNEITKNISTGFLQFYDDNRYTNGWIKHNDRYDQPILDSLVCDDTTDTVIFNTVDWKQLKDESTELIIFINGKKYLKEYERNNSRFIFPFLLQKNDVVSLKIFTDLVPINGYYQIPLGLEKNPLNEDLKEFTYGQAIDHLVTSLEMDGRLIGPAFGFNNLRDLDGYIDKSQRFLKHAYLSPLAQFLLCDKEFNIIKSLQFAKKSYTEFKNNFLTKSLEVAFDSSVADMVDTILETLSKSKNINSAFVGSDMIGSGAFTSLTYEVEDEGIKTFLLTERFSLDESSKRAVYVYINGIQLYNGEDYVFDKTFGTVNLKVNLSLNDIIEIREYISTSSNFIPATPTSVGMYKKYRPEKFLDNTYQEPIPVIQGHDGSIVIAYNDFRDDLLLELEKRIYNNIKNEYDPDNFDFDQIFGGYYGNSTYSKTQLDTILRQEFIKYIFDLSIDYTNNLYFDSENPFTYTYSDMSDPPGDLSLPGWWRGVYQWFYDTDRPHTRPWEILGFSIKPDWWNDVYGPAPYTSNNLILWEDIRDGIIRRGSRAGQHKRYSRATILNHLPVDEEGNLLDPLNSGLASNFVLINNKGSFVFGDISPVEYSWRSSSDFVFSMIIAACLLKPFDFIIKNFNLSNRSRNLSGHVIDKSTDTYNVLGFLNINNIIESSSLGLISYVISYCRERNFNLKLLEEKIKNIDVNLTSRLSGFVDKQQQKYILDSKSPKSISSNIFIPDENYKIIFNTSNPIFDASYSAVIVEKTDRGFKIQGYDILNPVFRYYKNFENQSDPLISVGGVTEKFVDWKPNTDYVNGQLIRNNNSFYRAVKTHNSGDFFDISNYKILPTLPLVGAVEAKRRKTFDKSKILNLEYGTVLESIQQVVDFLLGYESYLTSIGFIFDDYNPNLATSINWTLSCKEFMFWTRHSWAPGSLISLSPASNKITINNAVGVVESLIDGFYDYQVFQSDGTPINFNNLDVKRDFQTTVITVNNLNDGIYFIRLYYVLKEHITIFNDRTVFNDVIYDKSTGYRQDRIKSQGFRTVDWDGDYTSPGFLYDSAKIVPWEPFKDYKLGDIVSYQSVNYTSKINQTSSESFENRNWEILDVTPVEGLIPNFDYRINLFEDYFEADSSGIGNSQRTLARHSVAYQTREYLNNLAEDPVTQFQLYQGFIREKGTYNSVFKIFDKLGQATSQSIKINEEWAFLSGIYGGIDQTIEYEIDLNRSNFENNPQLILIEPQLPNTKRDTYYRLTEKDFSRKPLDFSLDLNPVIESYKQPLLTAGYVKKDQVDFVVKNRIELIDFDINRLQENDHIWITFDEKKQWEVLRFRADTFLIIESLELVSVQKLKINLSRPHKLSVDDVVGIKAIQGLEGFYQILETSFKSIIIDPRIDLTEFQNDDNFLDFNLVDSSRINLFTLTSARYDTFQSINEEEAALFPHQTRIFIDKSQEDLWEVRKKEKQYAVTELFEPGVQSPRFLGSKVVYDQFRNTCIVSVPTNGTSSDSGYIVVYAQTTRGLIARQIIAPPDGFSTAVKGSFGLKMCLSPDGKYLVVASPLASGVRSNYLGDYVISDYYAPDDIVLFGGRLWKCLFDQDPSVIGDGSTLDLKSNEWQLAKNIEARAFGKNNGFLNQGMITIYEYRVNQWVETESFVSPRPQTNENFGSDVSLGLTDDKYYLAVSAQNSVNKGRVYLYKFNRKFTDRRVITFPGTSIIFSTNTIVFTDHGFINGQRVLYFNGTLDGSNNTDRDKITSPSPPLDETVFYIIRSANATNNFRLAASISDFLNQIPVNLNDIGINDSSFHTLISPAEESNWEFLEDPNYVGNYNPSFTAQYPKNSIVFYQGNFYQSQTDQTGDGSTISVESNDWLKVDPVVTNLSLPQSIAVDDDGSILGSGLLNDNQVAELIKSGDGFGYSLTMNRDASILVVGAPFSDAQYFIQYRGIWSPTDEYKEDDVVKFQNNYYKLSDNSLVEAGGFKIGYRYTISFVGTTNWNSIGLDGPAIQGMKFIATGIGSGSGIAFEETDSTRRSLNDIPENGLPWISVGDSTSENSGKIFVYKRNKNEIYELVQTINNTTLLLSNEIDSTEMLSSGDQFGFSLDIDLSGRHLIVSSPKADINLQDQGLVYIFKTESLSHPFYRFSQTIKSFENYSSEYFGFDIKISDNSEKIAVGARNSRYRMTIIFDALSRTRFDGGATKFFDDKGFAGAVYVFDKKDQKYFLTEKLESNLSSYESFGYSIDCVNSKILVGSPDYNFDGEITGNVRLFSSKANGSSWLLQSRQQPVVDIDKIKSISFYDQTTNLKIDEIDIVDLAKLKILGIAEQEITYKTFYDPAIYSKGTEFQVIDVDIPWKEKHIGEVWWDISKIKTIYYEQGDLEYRSGNWNELAYGSSIDIYEWVESELLPSEWLDAADTTDGLSRGISGIPLHPDDTVYSEKLILNTNTLQPLKTLYYYWVKNKKTISADLSQRRITTSEIIDYIENPIGSGIPFIGAIDTNKFLSYNFVSLFKGERSFLNLLYYSSGYTSNPVHKEYQLLSVDNEDSLPNLDLERKWLDSLIGFDTLGNRIPDENLSDKQKYGIAFRPRQSMFVDRFGALSIAIKRINEILKLQPFSDIIDFTLLNSADPIPDEKFNLYDATVESFIDLQNVGTVKVTQAILKPNILNGEIDSIDVISRGFGYKVVPPVVIQGDGRGAEATVTLDNQGRISNVSILSKGKNYTSAVISVRNFAVLVKKDVTSRNFWSIYSWDSNRKTFFRTKTQAYDVTRFWSLIDWWETGFTNLTRISREIDNVFQEQFIDTEVGDIIRIKEYGVGGWAVFEKRSSNDNGFLNNFALIGRQNGTIEFSDELYSPELVGFDNIRSYDINVYDLTKARELRILLESVKKDIFVNELSVEWNKLFFSGVRYSFSEQIYLDWAFKTSFIKAEHDAGELIQKTNYKSDNLSSYQEYLQEVKPYRTTIREFISAYNRDDRSDISPIDFDMPVHYSISEGKLSVTDILDTISNTYPWKWFKDNIGFSIKELRVSGAGDQYINPPKVIIEGSGTGAKATAFISNGKVTSIRVDNPGFGYVRAPTVLLSGGTATGGQQASAVAVIGNPLFRSFALSIKFDRITKTGLYSSFMQTQEFIATGDSSVFDLNYAATNDKSKIKILKNDQIVLGNEFSVTFFRLQSEISTLPQGRIIFNTVPNKNDRIRIEYDKNEELFDAVNRIDRLYNPRSGMRGKFTSQLMTGIDFGGVQIQGSTFDVTGGWDALPWFTDSWDSIQPSADYYYVADALDDGSTTAVILPYVPAPGQIINIYLRRAGEKITRSPDKILTDEITGKVFYESENVETKTIRIDDPNFDQNWDSSSAVNPNAQMPTFVGDGSTRSIEIGRYIQTQVGDVLIFRPTESDGSVTIEDPTIIDTQLSGGTLLSMGSAYITATGKTADEILIDGANFISPSQVPAPEENVPGQILDSVSIKVFQNKFEGVSIFINKVVVSDGITDRYNLGQQVLSINNIVVYVDRIKLDIDQYTVDFSDDSISFNTVPAANSVIEILSLGVGGLSLLDVQTFVGDGETVEFIIRTNYQALANIFVTLDGIQTDVSFSAVEDISSTIKKTSVLFVTPPARNVIIKIVSLGAVSDVDSAGYSIIGINEEVLRFDGSTRKFGLKNFVDLSRGIARSSMLVEVNGSILRGVDTNFYIYDGVKNVESIQITEPDPDNPLQNILVDIRQVVRFPVAQDPNEDPGVVLSSNIFVYLNGIPTTDFSYDSIGKFVEFQFSAIKIGDNVRIENDLRSEYSIVNNDLVINSPLLANVDDEIKVLWFNEYPTLAILSDELVGGRANYQLAFTPVSVSFVWVYLNGQKLIQDVDFYLSKERAILYLKTATTELDLLKIVLFGTDIYNLPSAFEIYKDVLNRVHYKRFSKEKIFLTRDLNYYDTEIHLSDTSGLFKPSLFRNVPGIITVDNERIAYLEINGNVLTKIRRGSFGSPIKDVYNLGTQVINSGANENLPYTETQQRYDFISDGSTLIVGPLPYIPNKKDIINWFRETIPEEYGQCDEIEVFVSGKRLKKSPTGVYNENKGSYSPLADDIIESEFSVDGLSNSIRLTHKVSVGQRITIIKKIGKIWYDQGSDNITSGKTLLENNTAVAKFIAKKTTLLPE
jgi:hypothetical protein